MYAYKNSKTQTNNLNTIATFVFCVCGGGDYAGLDPHRRIATKPNSNLVVSTIPFSFTTCVNCCHMDAQQRLMDACGCIRICDGSIWVVKGGIGSTASRQQTIKQISPTLASQTGRHVLVLSNPVVRISEQKPDVQARNESEEIVAKLQGALLGEVPCTTSWAGRALPRTCAS